MEGRRQPFPLRHRELALPAQDFMAYRPVEVEEPPELRAAPPGLREQIFQPLFLCLTAS